MTRLLLRLDAAIKDQLAEVDRLQHVAAVDLPAAMRRWKELEKLKKRVTETKDLDELLKLLCDEQIVRVG